MLTLKYVVPAIIALACSPLPSLASAAGIARDTMQADMPASQQTIRQVHRFLERFIDPDKTPAEQAALFADNAEYYDQGVVGKARIAQDVKHFSKRWPFRAYRLAGVDSIIPDPESDRALVRYEIDFEVVKPEKTIVGSAYYIALIADLNGSPKVEKIEEIIERRKTYSTLDE